MPRLEIELQNGTTQQVEFDSMPSNDDIDHVAKHLSSIQPTIGKGFENNDTTFNKVKDSLYEPDSIGPVTSSPSISKSISQPSVQQNSQSDFYPTHMDVTAEYSQPDFYNDNSRLMVGRPNENSIGIGERVVGMNNVNKADTSDYPSDWQPSDLTLKAEVSKDHYLGDYVEPELHYGVNDINSEYEPDDIKNLADNFMLESPDDVVVDGNYYENPVDLAKQEEYQKQLEGFKQRENQYKQLEEAKEKRFFDAYKNLSGKYNDKDVVSKVAEKGLPYVHNFINALRRGGHQFRSGVYNMAGKVGAGLKNDKLVNWAYDKAMDASARMQSIQNGDGTVNYLTGMVGENAPMMAGGLISATAGLAAGNPIVAGAAVVTNFIWNTLFTSNYFEHRRELEEKFGRPLTQAEGWDLIKKDDREQIINAVLESAGDFITSKLAFFGIKPTENALLNTAISVASNTAEEGYTEYLQEAQSIDTEKALGLNNATSVENAERQNEAAKGGAVMGGLFGGFGAARGLMSGDMSGGVSSTPTTDLIRGDGTDFTLPGGSSQGDVSDIEASDEQRRLAARDLRGRNKNEETTQTPSDFQYPALANQFEQQTSLEPPQSSGTPVEQQTGQNIPNNTETLQNEQSDMSETDEQPKRKRGGKTRAEMQANYDRHTQNLNIGTKEDDGKINYKEDLSSSDKSVIYGEGKDGNIDLPLNERYTAKYPDKTPLDFRDWYDRYLSASPKEKNLLLDAKLQSFKTKNEAEDFYNMFTNTETLQYNATVKNNEIDEISNEGLSNSIETERLAHAIRRNSDYLDSLERKRQTTSEYIQNVKKAMNELDSANKEGDVDKGIKIVKENNIKQKYLTPSQREILAEHYSQRAAKANNELKQAIADGDAKKAQQILDKNKNVIYNDIAYSAGEERTEYVEGSHINYGSGSMHYDGGVRRTGETWEGNDVEQYRKLAQNKIDNYQKQIDKINNYKPKHKPKPSNMHIAKDGTYKKTSDTVDSLFSNDGSDVTSYVNSNKSVGKLSEIVQKLMSKYKNPTNAYEQEQNYYANKIKKFIQEWNNGNVYLIHDEIGNKLGNIAFRVDKNDNIYIDAYNDNPAKLISQAIDRIAEVTTKNGSRPVRGYAVTYDELPVTDVQKSNYKTETYNDKIGGIVSNKNKENFDNIEYPNKDKLSSGERHKLYIAESMYSALVGEKSLEEHHKNSKTNIKYIADVLYHNNRISRDVYNKMMSVKNVPISISDKNDTNRGYYDPKSKSITVTLDATPSTLVHEIRHALQDSFARSNGEFFKEFFNPTQKALFDIRNGKTIPLKLEDNFGTRTVNVNLSDINNAYKELILGDKKSYQAALKKLSKELDVPIAELKLLSDTYVRDAYMNARLSFKEIDAYMSQHNFYFQGGRELSVEEAYELWKACKLEIDNIIDGGNYETYIEAREDIARLLRQQLPKNGVYHRSSTGKGNINRTTSKGTQGKQRGESVSRRPSNVDTELILEEASDGTPSQQERTKLYEDLVNADISRSNSINKAKTEIDSNVSDFNKSIKKTVGGKIKPEIARKLIPFLREGKGFPKSMPELSKAYNKLSSAQQRKLQKLSQSLYNGLSSHWKEYSKWNNTKSTIDDNTYVPHSYKGKTEADQRLLDKYYNIETILLNQNLKTNSKFAIHRINDSLSDVIDNGLKVKAKNGKVVTIQVEPELDYSKLMTKHSNDLATAVANDKFINKFEYRKMSDGSHATDSDLYDEFYNRITEANVDKTKFGETYDAVNNASKAINFYGSLFHHKALTESAVGVSIKGAAKALKGDYRLGNNKKLASEAAENGVVFGALSDAQVNEIEGTLDKIIKYTDNHFDKAGNLISLGTKALKAYNSINNKFLWEYLHNSYKLMSYDFHCELYKKKNKTDTIPKAVLQEIGQFSNDLFGGQTYSTLGLSKKDVLWLQRTLLSPDWNISAGMREPLSFFCNAPLQKGLNLIASKSENGRKLRELCRRVGLSSINNSVEGAKVRGKLGRRYNTRYVALIGGLGTLCITAVYRLKDQKEHPEYYPDGIIDYLTPWDNNKFEPGKENIIEKAANTLLPDAFLGRNEYGREMYGRTGKQGREAFEFLENGHYSLADKLASKSSFAVKPIATKLSSSLARSSKDAKIRNKYGWKDSDSLLTSMTKSFKPFITDGGIEGIKRSPRDAFLGKASIQHTNRYSAAHEASEYIKSGDIDKISSKEFRSKIRMNNLKLPSVLMKSGEELFREYLGDEEATAQIETNLRATGLGSWYINKAKENAAKSPEQVAKEEAEYFKNKNKSN